MAEKLSLPQETYPIAKRVQISGVDRVKPCREGLGAFGLPVAGVLIDAALHKVDVLLPQRCNRPTARACQHPEGKHSLAAAFNRACAGHLAEGGTTLFDGWKGRVAFWLGNAGILGTHVEIFGIGRGDAGFVTGLARQPLNESLQVDRQRAPSLRSLVIEAVRPEAAYTAG